ncbi:MAG: serine/threonine-protein kinase, partial [Acidobacteriota bacterium]
NDVTLTAPLSEPSAVPPADGPRFVSGAILAGRYRIVGLLGRGGMGEVYRADDLKLGQSVALKFLPQGLDSDHERLRRLLDEVRVALRVTHTNVCRVYDIGEIDGSHYLSMEYIDGEDLSALLRRIGRLPEDKAIQIARQLCAGLAAAHEQGILHRDLKPANVMIDGRGDVRITDFGLAGLADSFTGLEIRAGTPAFMAPEQLAGKEVTVKSDIYALGLVLYELFTGQRAFTGQSIEELSEMQASGPSRPSTHVELLDPTVESVILRCLANDPAERPDSVLKVAVALPGADPLAAALAAGETPSPELVAESGDDSGLEPRVAVPIMVLTLLGLLASAWLIGRYQLLGRVPMELPPQVLAHRAQEIAESLGYADPPADRAWGFRTQPAVLEHLANDPSPDRWERLSNARPSAIRFWYRQSPFPLIPQNAYGRVGFNDPQVRYSGMVNLFLDSTGRLTHLKAVPPQYDDAPPDQPQLEPDWRIAFEAAELEFERFTPTTPHWLPEKYCDRRAAWLGVYPSGSESVAPSIEVRVEACAYRGRLIQFAASPQIGRPFLQEAPQRTRTQQVRRVAEGLVAVIFLLGTVMLARRNLALGRGDRRSALLLATWVAVTSMGTWLFQASHVLDLNIEKILINRRLGNALFDAAVFWLFYIALEPFVRSRWPKSLVSWNRLLAGRLNDPLVGRHLLYGAALGVGIGLMHQLGAILPMLVGKAQAMPRAIDFDTLLGTHWVLGEMFDALRVMATDPLAYLLF